MACQSSPASATFEIVSGPLVRLERVIVFGLEAVPAFRTLWNTNGAGLKTTKDGLPAPESVTVWSPSSLGMCTVAVSGP